GRYKTAVQQFEAACKAAEEEAAYKKAIASCSDLLPAGDYLRKYPNGRYRTAVEQFEAVCQAAEATAAYKKAIASCADLLPAGEYRRKYPNGRYTREVEQFLARCQAPAPTPERVVYRSRVGWTLSYDGAMLYVPPDGNDTYDSARSAY